MHLSRARKTPSVLLWGGGEKHHKNLELCASTSVPFAPTVWSPSRGFCFHDGVIELVENSFARLCDQFVKSDRRGSNQELLQREVSKLSLSISALFASIFVTRSSMSCWCCSTTFSASALAAISFLRHSDSLFLASKNRFE